VNDSIDFNDIAEMPLPDVLNRYQALNERDYTARAISTLKARGREPKDLNPDDYPPLTSAEHLELLALGEHLARYYRHPAQIHHAVLAGASWEDIAAATGGDPDQARQGYREWAQEQYQLRQQFPGGSIGLGGEEYAAAIEAAGEPHADIVPDTAAEDTRRAVTFDLMPNDPDYYFVLTEALGDFAARERARPGTATTPSRGSGGLRPLRPPSTISRRHCPAGGRPAMADDEEYATAIEAAGGAR
jgi:hypothetical protein